jgi:hypothetical protein
MTRALATLALGFCLTLAAAGAAGAPPSDDDLPAWLEEQVEAVRPRPEEKKFDSIGWAADIREALRLAKEHGRPVFLFTHDGQIDTGRC